MSIIHCKVQLYQLGKIIVLRLPKEASAQMPSRGQTMVAGTLNGVSFETPLEPDGNWSHWFSPDKALLSAAGAGPGNIVTLSFNPIKRWPEPTVPKDIQQALDKHPAAQALWKAITPMARWEWVRWVRSTGNTQTRARRIAVACSKLQAGKRRPCCWNRNLCTEPSVSKNGVLLEAA